MRMLFPIIPYFISGIPLLHGEDVETKHSGGKGRYAAVLKKATGVSSVPAGYRPANPAIHCGPGSNKDDPW